MRTCRVGFVDTNGTRHAVDVMAESVFEAAVCGIKAISESWAEQPGNVTEIQVSVTAPVVTHHVTIRQLKEWITSTSRSPKEAVLKERLKSLLPSVAD